MNCLIIDDEEMASSHLKRLCEKIPSISSIHVCSSAIEGLQEIESSYYHLLFLDIEMPDMTGMELLRNFRQLPPVILTTSKKEFALESYEHGVVDYLIKPVDLVRLMKAVAKVESKLKVDKPVVSNTSSDNFFVRSEGKHIQLHKNDILYIETMDDYLIFYLEGGKKHIVHGTLKKMEEKLNCAHFLKVHRSFLINLNKISSIEDTHLEIQNIVIPVSRSNRPILMEKVKTL